MAHIGRTATNSGARDREGSYACDRGQTANEPIEASTMVANEVQCIRMMQRKSNAFDDAVQKAQEAQLRRNTTNQVFGSCSNQFQKMGNTVCMRKKEFMTKSAEKLLESFLAGSRRRIFESGKIGSLSHLARVGGQKSCGISICWQHIVIHYVSRGPRGPMCECDPILPLSEQTISLHLTFQFFLLFLALT